MEFSTEDLRTWVARQTRVIPTLRRQTVFHSNERRHATHLSQRSAAINHCEKALHINPPYGDDPLPTRASALSAAAQMREQKRIRRIRAPARARDSRHRQVDRRDLAVCLYHA